MAGYCFRRLCRWGRRATGLGGLAGANSAAAAGGGKLISVGYAFYSALTVMFLVGVVLVHEILEIFGVLGPVASGPRSDTATASIPSRRQEWRHPSTGWPVPSRRDPGVLQGDLASPFREPQLRLPEPDTRQPGASRPGSLELRLGGNLGLRALRYTLHYQPARADDAVKLAKLETDPQRIVPVHAMEIGADPQRYRKLRDPDLPLCTFGLTLSAQQPACAGVLRLADKLEPMPSSTSKLRMQAELLHPRAGQSELIEAQATARLRNVFYVSISGPPRFGSAVFELEQDPKRPEVYFKRPLLLWGCVGGEPRSTQCLRHLEVARDGERLYVASQEAMLAWHGDFTQHEEFFRVFPGLQLMDLSLLDHGVCVLEGDNSSERPRGMVFCRGDHASGWNDGHPLYPLHPIAHLAGLGDSLLVIEGLFNESRPLYAALMRDALHKDASLRRFMVGSGMVPEQHRRSVLGVLPLTDARGGSDYLLWGRFDQAGYGLLPLRVLAKSFSDQVPAAGLQSPAFAPLHVDAPLAASAVEAWTHTSGTMARAFMLVDGKLYSTDYNLLQRKAGSQRAIELAQGLRATNRLRLLDLAPAHKMLAVAARAAPLGSLRLLMVSMPGVSAQPKLAYSIDFEQECEALNMVCRYASVQAISGTAMVLSGPEREVPLPMPPQL